MPKGQQIEIVEDTQISLTEIWRYLLGLGGKMRLYGRAYFAILAILILCWLCVFLFSKPLYSAVAIIGPPNPSPVSGMIASMGASGFGGMARRITGGGSGTNDPFEEFQQLLASDRMAAELAEKDRLLPIVFPGAWDAASQSWKVGGPLRPLSSAIKRLLHRPVVDHPTWEMLRGYLNKNLSIEQAKGTETATISISVGGNVYLRLALTASSPAEAEHLLTTIINRADTTIREEQLRDVEARIAYIEKELQTVTQTEPRTALIQALASQEEMRMLIVADKRYAIVQISAPRASVTPTKPMPPGKAIILSIFLAFIVYGLSVLIAEKSKYLHAVLSRFAKPVHVSL